MSLQDDIYALAGDFQYCLTQAVGRYFIWQATTYGGEKEREDGAWSTSADVLEQLALEGHVLPQRF